MDPGGGNLRRGGAGGEVGAGGVLQVLGTVVDGVVAAILGDVDDHAGNIIGNLAVGDGQLGSRDLACEGVGHCIVGAANLSCDNELAACAGGAGRAAGAGAVGVAAVGAGVGFTICVIVYVNVLSGTAYGVPSVLV